MPNSGSTSPSDAVTSCSETGPVDGSAGEDQQPALPESALQVEVGGDGVEVLEMEGSGDVEDGKDAEEVGESAGSGGRDSVTSASAHIAAVINRPVPRRSSGFTAGR